MFVNILLVILIFLRLIIGGQLLVTAKRHNLPNLYWLAGSFFATAIGALFAPTTGNPLGDLALSKWLYTGVATILTTACLIGFNETTFYKGRKSPLWWYVGAFIVFTAIGVYGLLNSESNYAQNPQVAFATIPVLLVWCWHGWLAFQAFAVISKDSAVEDWVKARYQLMIAYSIFLSIAPVATFVRIYFAGGTNLTPLGNATAFVTLIAQIISVTLLFLVWVMPEAFQQWLNRNQQTHTEEELHRKALTILDMVGTAMSTDTGISKMVALFSVREIIGEQIKTEDSQQIEQYVTRMGYDEWMAVINNPELYLLVKNAGTLANPALAVEQARRALTEKQSLFTMQAK